MHLLRYALLLTALFVAVPAQADTIGVHLVSKHIPAKKFNNVNPGLYYQTDDGWTVGGYHNSLRRNSVYAGYTWKLGALDVTTGAVTGYQHKVQPMLVPSLKVWEHEGVRVRVAYIPQVEKKIGSHVLHLMMEY